MKTEYMFCVKILVGLIFSSISLNTFSSEDYSFPISFQKIIHTYTVKKDGSFEEINEKLTRIDNEDGVSNFGEDKISFIPKVESIKILDAYTILPDGSRLEVPPENIRTAKGDMKSTVASFSDKQYKVIIFPGVAVGSQLYLKYSQTRHTPLFNGQFAVRDIISPFIKYAHFEVNINFDPGINIKVDSNGVEGGPLPDKDGMRRYRFTSKQDKIIPYETGQIDSDDYAPYVQASTFANYEALGAAYHEKAKQKARVTPVIQKLANDLTKGVDDKRAQTRILYN